MSKYITAFFTDEDGNEALSLAPSIIIKNVVDNSTVATGSMTEVGNGVYKYLFSAYLPDNAYAFVCDSGMNTSGRFAYGTSDSSQAGEDAWEEPLAAHTTNGTFGTLIKDSLTGVGL